MPANETVDAVAEIAEEGHILLNDIQFAAPGEAAAVASGSIQNGWTFWLADLPTGLRSLAQIREEYLSSDVASL